MASERTLGACLPLPATGRPHNRFASGKIDVYGKAPLPGRAPCAEPGKFPGTHAVFSEPHGSTILVRMA